MWLIILDLEGTTSHIPASLAPPQAITDPRLSKDQQINYIFGVDFRPETNEDFGVGESMQEVLSKYCLWDIQNHAGMDSEMALRQKEDMYYRLLENYTYEKIATFDTNKKCENVAFRCKFPDCNRILDKPWDLLEHVRMHEEAKPHQCEWWGKTFTQRGNLKKHVRQHINPDVNQRKRFKCRLCDKGYTERYNLKVSILADQIFSTATMYFPNYSEKHISIIWIAITLLFA